MELQNSSATLGFRFDDETEDFLRDPMRKKSRPPLQTLPLDIQEDDESRDDRGLVASSSPTSGHDEEENHTDQDHALVMPHSAKPSRHVRSKPSLYVLHLELARAERQLMEERMLALQGNLESLHKANAYEKSQFMMRQGQLAVEIEGLQEDKFFLLQKREKLGKKLLKLHVDRVNTLKDEDCAGATSS